MQLPVNITYRGLNKSEKIDNLVMTYAARLDKFCDHINRCDVAIEQQPYSSQRKSLSMPNRRHRAASVTN